MTDVNKVIFTGGSINSSEELQNIRESIEEKEFDMLIIDKNSLLGLFDYIDRLQLGDADNEKVDSLKRYDLNG
jgi:hypothetical protein